MAKTWSEVSFEYDMKCLEEFLARFPRQPTKPYWYDGSEILCNTEQRSECLADLIEWVFHIDAHTGYYDPAEDKVEHCVDNHTGWYYVDFD